VCVAYLRYVGGEDDCFSSVEVLASGHLRWAFGQKLLCGSFLGGISCVVCRAREHSGCQCWDLQPRSSESQTRKRKNGSYELKTKGNETCGKEHGKLWNTLVTVS
jgi:hypothetical protein